MCDTMDAMPLMFFHQDHVIPSDRDVIPRDQDHVTPIHRSECFRCDGANGGDSLIERVTGTLTQRRGLSLSDGDSHSATGTLT